MNVVNEMCSLMIKSLELKSHNIIKKKRIYSELDKIYDNIMMKDIFIVSDEFVQFFSSLPYDIVNKYKIKVKNIFLEFNLADDIIYYNSKRKYFTIYHYNLSHNPEIYTIDKNNNIIIPSSFKLIWERTIPIIKDFYISTTYKICREYLKKGD